MRKVSSIETSGKGIVDRKFRLSARDFSFLLIMCRILIVEDESRVSAFLEKGFQKYGFFTTVAGDGNQAIQIAQSEDVQLLLLDLGLPIKDGYSVLRELRALGHNLPIIVISAQDNEQSKASALKCGATDFVSKPFHFSQLLEKVRLHLNRVP
jgi:two-component system, OmpR family, copper resistance phosphate regulon response regulator CusR